MNTKKISLILLIISISSFIISSIIFSAIVFSNDNVDEMTHTVNEEQVVEFLGSNIDISAIFSNIDIVSYDEPTVKVSLEGDYRSLIRDDNLSLDILETGNSLDISIKNNRPLGFMSLAYFSADLELKVYLPKDYSGNINIDGISKEINISDLSLSKLKISGITGEVNIENVNTNKIDIEALAGNINLENITGDLNLGATAADIYIKYLEYDNYIDINAFASNINIYLPKGSEFYLDSDSFISETDYLTDTRSQEYIRNGNKNPVRVNSFASSIRINEY